MTDKNHRLYLRAFEPDDYKTTIIWRNDPEIWDMLGGTRYFVSEAYEKKWVENAIFNSRDMRLAVCIKDSGLHIGNVYATDIDLINRSCRTHIMIGNHEYWGSGYATEAMRSLIDFLINERGIQRFEAHVLHSNIGSIKMHEKCGYCIEGTLRRSIFKNGRYHDQVVMGLLAEEFRS